MSLTVTVSMWRSMRLCFAIELLVLSTHRECHSAKDSEKEDSGQCSQFSRVRKRDYTGIYPSFLLLLLQSSTPLLELPPVPFPSSTGDQDHRSMFYPWKLHVTVRCGTQNVHMPGIRLHFLSNTHFPPAPLGSFSHDTRKAVILLDTR